MQYKLDKPVHASIGIEKYQSLVEWRNGKFISDEAFSSGGRDSGPDPYTLLISSIATCTLATLRMYIDKKGWDIPSISVNANMYQETEGDQTTTVIDRDISFITFISEEQKTRLMEIATNCPVSKILKGPLKVRTFVFRDGETKTINYANEEITVVWKPEFCQHSTRCFTQLPQVFDPKIRKWINPDGAPAEKIEQQVKACPSGALSFHFNTKEGSDEQ